SLNLFSARKRFFCIHSLNLIESCDCAVRGVRRSRVFASPLHISALKDEWIRESIWINDPPRRDQPGSARPGAGREARQVWGSQLQTLAAENVLLPYHIGSTKIHQGVCTDS
ncbi:hypothetical protein LINPERPRIM_LOCUS15245, partial [Linum perenne]